jgi:flavoprotein
MHSSCINPLPDVKEPRILHLLPQFVEAVVRICARVVDLAVNATHPVTREQHEQLAKIQVCGEVCRRTCQFLSFHLT